MRITAVAQELRVHRMLELARKRSLVLHARGDEHAIQQLFALGPGLRVRRDAHPGRDHRRHARALSAALG